jgi:hypothetical protein
MKNLYKIEDELYIISNTENVDENCWIITDGKLVQVSYLLSDEVAKGNKVILTTNKLLIKDGVQAIDDEFLEWFVKNPSCEEVGVEKYCRNGLCDGGGRCRYLCECIGKRIIIPKEETCTCTDECLGYLTKTCKRIEEEPKQEETLKEVDEIKIMSLRDKIKTAFLEEDRNVEMFRKIEKIADEFAIGFAEWLSEYAYKESVWRMFDKGDESFTLRQLLEIYKKEKGL